MRAVYEWWNWAKLLTMKNYVHFFCETGAFIRKYQNRFTPANQLFWFYISFSKNFVTDFWNWSIFQKLVQPLKIYFAIQFSALNRVFRFSSPNVIKQRIRISWWINKAKFEKQKSVSWIVNAVELQIVKSNFSYEYVRVELMYPS